MHRYLRPLQTTFAYYWLLIFIIIQSCDWSFNNDEYLKRNTGHLEPYKLYGLNFSPFLKGKDPTKGDKITDDEMAILLQNVAPYTKWIRTFGTTNGLEHAGQIAYDFGLKTAIGAWLDSDLPTNEEEIANLINIANAGYVDLAVVGSEVLVRSDLTEEQLISYINKVRESIPDTIPVTTAGLCDVLLNHPSVIANVDVVFVNLYPFWKGIKIDCAISALHACYQRLSKLAMNKLVFVSETGWPSGGGHVGNAIASPENASLYFLNFISWARNNNVPSFYFEAYDERWKARYEGPIGSYWGIGDEDGNLKLGMEIVFNGVTISDNWSDISVPGGYGNPVIEFTSVPPYRNFRDLKGQVWHARPTEYKVVVYILVSSRWWIKPYFNRPLTIIDCDGSWTCDITTGGIDERAKRIIAFLIPNGYNPPLAAGWSSLPQELFDNAIAQTEVKRSR